jgi:hypothetical protein
MRPGARRARAQECCAYLLAPLFAEMDLERSRNRTDRQAWPWCLVMMDGRPHARVDSRLADHKVRSPLELVARINEIYAKIHGYALLLAELEVNDCTVDKGSPRAASWCKIPVLASVLLHGIDSRACANVMFLDSDAYVETLSVSVDEYLRALEQRGDESLSTDSNWEVLFSSGSWFIPDDVCAGVLWLRGSSSACGFLRRWWTFSSHWHSVRRPWENHAASQMYLWNRPFGDMVRLAPSTNFYRRGDAEWGVNPKYSLCGKSGCEPDPLAPYREDHFIHHGVKSSPPLRPVLAAARVYAGERVGMPPPGALATFTRRFKLAELGAIFDASGDRCPPLAARDGVAKGWNSSRTCCGKTTRLFASQTFLNGTRSPVPRPCWQPSRTRAHLTPHEHYSCAESLREDPLFPRLRMQRTNKSAYTSAG